jgi:coenzyme F420-0:L-glutamate ligase/coenzyme F420-1:gamma-L-glutamate ligase
MPEPAAGPSDPTEPNGPAGPGGPSGPVWILPVRGIGEVAAGDDVSTLLLAALTAAGERMLDGDVLVVSSKIISKAEGRQVEADGREQAIAGQTVRRVAARRTPHGLAQIVEAAAGPVMAAAGVDASNVAPGTVLLLPVDADASARALRARVAAVTGARVAVLVSDTAGRAWRNGQIDFALGAAGIAVTDDLRGSLDSHGQVLEVTVRAVADELAAAADLVKGKLTGVPVAIVRGTGAWVRDDDGPGAAALLRPAGDDWFRYGHAEAVTAALGLDPGAVEPSAVPPGPLEARLRRVLTLATSAPTPWADGAQPAFAVRVRDGTALLMPADWVTADQADRADRADWADLGALAQRISMAAWAEDLVAKIDLVDGGVRVSVRPCSG